jgi:hypothetical protein
VLKPQQLLDKVERAGAGAPAYAAQRAYVALMFEMIGRLLVAASKSDPEIQREIEEGYREGLSIGFSVLGDPGLRMRVGVRDGRFVRLPSTLSPELEIVFKHLSHAFYVLSFKESTARAYANERMLTLGDVALALRFVRCMNRMQAIALPRFVADRALKGFPDITPPEKRKLVTHLYGHLVRGLASRS